MSRWFEEKKLKGFRTPSGRLRVDHDSVRDLLKAHGRPIPKLLEGGDILVVDDDLDVLDMLVAALTRKFKHRVTVRACRQGQEALHQMNRRLPDVAVVDAVMAHVSGWKVCEAIRAKPGGERVQLIVITGHREKEEFKKMAKNLGAEYLAKPLILAGLLERVQDHLSLITTDLPVGAPQ